MRGSVLRIAKSYQRLAPISRTLDAIMTALLLTACSPPNGVVDPVHTFNQRVAATLNTQPAELSYSPRPAPMPPVRELKPTGESAGMSFLTSLRLGHCRAGQLIAQRNSSLGRLEDGLMRYQDDIAILQALKSCLDDPKSAPIRDEIAQAISAKAQQLEFDKAHALATDKALRHALSVGNQPLSTIDNSAFTTQLAALTKITNWLEDARSELPNEAQKLDEWRKQLVHSDYLPRLLRATIEMRLKLEQLQRQLPSVTQLAGCDSKGIPERAKVLRNVFITFFINDIQANLASLTTQYQQLTPVLERLAQQVPQAALKRYLTELSQHGRQLTQRSKEFVQPWQQLFADCNFTPGTS